MGQGCVLIRPPAPGFDGVAAKAEHKVDIQLLLRRKREEDRNQLCHRLNRAGSSKGLAKHQLYYFFDWQPEPHLSNGLDRSCEATIYPVLDKPRNSEALGPRGPLLKEICPLVFKIPFTIRLDRR